MWPFDWLFGKTNVRFEAVLLIDMQTNFVNKLEAGTKSRLVAAQTAVIRQCAVKNIPLIVLSYRAQGVLIEELQSEVDKVPRVTNVERDEYDAFYHTDLEQILDGYRVESFLLTGINASCCVRHTAETALQKKFRVITALDLIADGSNIIGPTSDTEVWFRRKCVMVQNPAMLFAAPS